MSWHEGGGTTAGSLFLAYFPQQPQSLKWKEVLPTPPFPWKTPPQAALPSLAVSV